MRERMRRSVVFPAPLWPIRPTTSLRSMLKETSRNAQKSVASEALAPVRRPSRRKLACNDSVRRLYVAWSDPSFSRLPSPSTSIAQFNLDYVCECALDPTEVVRAADEQNEGDRDRHEEARPREHATEDGPP